MVDKQKQIDRAFYSDGYKLGSSAVVPELTQQSLFAAMQKMYAAIDGLIDSLTEFARNQNQGIDCKKGCDWCCHQPVFALSYEMEYLNDFLKKKFDEPSRKEIRSRAERKNNTLKLLSEKDLLKSKFPCALLENGVCIAYEARPMACRIYLSSNVNSCLSFYNHPDDEKNFPALLDFPMRAGRMMNEGFKAALKSGNLSTQEFRIEEILLVPPVKISGVKQ